MINKRDVMSKFFVVFLLLCAAGFASDFEIKCTDNVLKQISPLQNACVLEESIPKSLQGHSYIVYPTQFLLYNTERFNFNKRFNVFPKAIIIPKSEKTLAKTLKLLRENNLNFSVRSGGHCFEPGSLSSDYILDLRHFNEIKVVGNHEVYAGAGVRLGPLIEVLGKFDWALPTGTCQSVGISGLALGGGIGFLARTHGLTCDAIKSIVLLTADSNIIEVDQGLFSDLFWALRGAGNNSYGIVLGFTFKAFDVPAASFFELKWDWDSALVLHIVQAWHAWIANLPDTINPVLSMGYHNGALSISIIGLKVGKDPFVEWQSAFKSLTPMVNIKTGSYLELAQFWADSPKTPFGKVKSLMAFQPVPGSAVNLAIDYLQTLQSSGAKFQVNLQLVALGGKFAQGDTAFFPRDAVEWWHQVANWDEQDQGAAALSSLRGFYASVQPLVSNYCYSNDTDYDLGDTYLNAYWGDHVSRLMRIKRKYDPNNVFNWAQSIPKN